MFNYFSRIIYRKKREVRRCQSSVSTSAFHQKYRYPILLIFLVALSTLSTDLYAPAMPSMVLALNTTKSALQSSMISYMYGFAICMIFSGILADVLGRKKTLLLGLAIYTLSSGLLIFTHSLAMLLYLRFFQALGGCCGTVIARVMVRESFAPPEAIKLLATLSTGMSIAFIIAPMIGSMLTQLYHWQACFVFMSVLGALLFGHVYRYIEDTQTKAKTALWSNEKTEMQLKGMPLQPKFWQDIKLFVQNILMQYSRALRCKDFVTHTLSIALAWTGFFMMIIEYPFLLLSKLRCSTLWVGVIFAIILSGYCIGTKIARMSFSGFSTPHDRAAVGVWVMWLAGFCSVFLNYIYLQTFFSVVGPAFVYMIGMGIQMPNSQYAAIPEKFRASAVVTSLLYFIEMVLSAVLGQVFKTYGAMGALQLWCLIFLLLTILLIVYQSQYFFMALRKSE